MTKLQIGTCIFLLYGASYIWSDTNKAPKNISEHEKTFTEIYKHNKWKDPESKSGAGSNLHASKKLRLELPRLFNELSIESILDVPCGDFNWMRFIDFEDKSYIGGDIVKDIITKNNETYGNKQRAFIHLNAAADQIPQVDLILCRDLLVHLSLPDALATLRNFKKSGSKYLLVTTHRSRGKNKDITMGRWRKLNLERTPFNFPKPLKVIYEESPEKVEFDKYLGLWRLEDLPI